MKVTDTYKCRILKLGHLIFPSRNRFYCHHIDLQDLLDQQDVILYDNKLCVYKQAVDATLYVIGGAEENEIMLYLVVVALRDCLDALLKYSLNISKVDVVIRLIRGRFLKIMTLSLCASMRFVMMGEPFQYVLC